MACLHELGEAEASTLRDRLEARRPMTHSSMVTLLRRLQERQLVDRRKADVGKAHVYFPTEDAQSTFGRVTGRLAERIFQNDPISMISSLLGAKPPTRSELDRLRELVQELYEDDAASPREGDDS